MTIISLVKNEGTENWYQTCGINTSRSISWLFLNKAYKKCNLIVKKTYREKLSTHCIVSYVQSTFNARECSWWVPYSALHTVWSYYVWMSLKAVLFLRRKVTPGSVFNGVIIRRYTATVLFTKYPYFVWEAYLAKFYRNDDQHAAANFCHFFADMRGIWKVMNIHP